MAAKYVQPLEMIQITGRWKDPASEARLAILAVQDLAPLLGRALSAHDVLSAALQPPPVGEIKKIVEEQVALDFRHDTIIRGLWYLFGALADLLGGEAATALIELRGIIIPDGLPSMLKTYRAEAGQASQLEDRVTPEIKARLEAILVGPPGSGLTALSLVKEWITLGGKLGVLEDKKVALSNAPSKSAAQKEIDAKNLWIRTMNMMVAAAELAEVPEETMQLIFGPLWAAEAAAEKRARAAPAPEPEKKPDAPAAADGKQPEKKQPEPAAGEKVGEKAGEKAEEKKEGAEGTPAPGE